MNIEEFLGILVDIAEKTKDLDRQLGQLGYTDTPYWELYGKTLDAIYALIGEPGTDFENSITFNAFINDDLMKHQRVQMLLNEYKRNKA